MGRARRGGACDRAKPPLALSSRLAGQRGDVQAALKVFRTQADARGMTFILIAAPAVALVGIGAVVFTAALRQIPELLP